MLRGIGKWGTCVRGRGIAMFLATILGTGGLMAQESQLLVPDAGEDKDTALVRGDSRMEELNAAIKTFAQGDFEGAERQMQRATEKYPELPPADVLIAKLFSDAKNPAAARNALEKAVRDVPDDPEAYVIFGQTALQQARFTDAELIFKRAIEVCSKYSKNAERKKNLNVRALDGLAAVAEARADFPLAEKYLRELVAASEKDFAAVSRLGRALYKQKKEEDAYKVFGQAYEIDKTKVPRPEVYMARLYQEDGKDKEAQNLMDKVKSRDPNSLATRLSIAQWALETGRQPEAEENMAAAVQLAPDDFQVLMLQGIVARIKKEYPVAETAFLKALGFNPQNAMVMNQLAIALCEQDDDAKKQLAFQYVQLAAQLAGNQNTPQARQTQIVAAWVLYKIGRLPLAERQLQTAMAAGGSVGEDEAYFAAKILHESGKTENSLELLNKCLDESKRLFPNRGDAKELRAKILAGK